MYEVFEVSEKLRDMLVNTVHAVCDQWPEHKNGLRIMRAVVAMFDENLSLAAMSVRSLWLKPQKESNSQSTASGSWASDSDTNSSSDSGDDETTSNDDTTESP